MANKALKEAAAIRFLGSFLEGLSGSIEKRKELEKETAKRLIEQQKEEAERDLERRKFELQLEEKVLPQTIIGAEGQIITSPGLSRERIERLRLPGMIGPLPKEAFEKQAAIPGILDVGPSRKLTVQRAFPTPKAPRTKVPKSVFLKSPESFAGQDIDIVEDTPRVTAIPEDKRFALDTAKQLMKEFISKGSLSKEQANLLQDISTKFDPSIVPEEEKGVVAFISQILGDPRFRIKVAAPTNKSELQTKIRVRHKASEQTGTIPINEFDPNIYEKL